MCAIMEKEDLLLDVSASVAFVTYGNPVNQICTSQDLSRLAHIRKNLLINDPEYDSLDDVLNELKTIKDKYVNLPMFLNYFDEQDNDTD